MDSETVKVSLTCVECEVQYDLALDRAGYEAWVAGTPIQKTTLARMDVDMRELLVSSKGGRPRCGKCFDKLFG